MADVLPLCPSCSTPLPSGALFCTICGAATPTSLDSGETTRLAAPEHAEDGEVAYRDRLQRALGNGYVLGERIGRGGFGAVYRVRDVRLKRDVAVKVLRADLMESRDLEVRFLREAEAVAQLRHPNIIPIYGVGEGDGLIYFIMPLVQGESLLARLQREGPLPIPEVRRILADVASALTVAHKAGIVHRDLKPENIMLEGDARHVLLMDFGIAKTLGAGAGLTSHGMILGTPYYMSPEQAMGAKELDGRSDVYSLGVVGFQMLTGRVPFHGESVQSVLLMHISTPPPEIQSLRPDTPTALSQCVMRCLAKKPQERWSSSAELAGVLSGASPPATITSWRPARPAWLTGRRVALSAAALIAIAGGTFAVERLPGRTTAGSTGHTPWEDLGVSVEYDTLAYRVERPTWLASLGDTALILPYDSLGELWTFSGDSLHPVAGTKGANLDPPFAMARDTAWGVWEYGIEYIGAHGLVHAGDMAGDVAVASAWSDGRDLIVGLADGSIQRRTARGWRREATGTRHAIREIFGRDSVHQFALAAVADAQVTDSLFLYDGLGWSARDVRPDPAIRVRYAAGRAFADGGIVLVGTGCGASSGCRPLALRQDSAGAAWREVPLTIPPLVRMIGIWGASSRDFYLWGNDTSGAALLGCGGGGPCLWHVTGHGAEPVTALGPIRVIGMASMRGAPYVLLEDGTLRTSRGNGWPVAARLPGSTLVGVAGMPRLGAVVLSGDGVARYAGDELAPSRGQRFVSVVARDSTVWLLTDSGSIYEASCGESDCRKRALPLPDRRRVNGIAVLPNGFLEAVGRGGLAALWNGNAWRADSIPVRKPGEDLLHIVANRWAAAAVGDNLYRRDSTGRWRFLTSEGDSGFVIAPLADSTVAAANEWQAEDDTPEWMLQRFWTLRDTATSTPDNSDELMDSKVPMTIHVLPDGRLVAGLRQPDDPSVGGWLQIWSPPYGENRFVRIDLPRRSDVYGLADDGHYLYVVGSGWFSMRIPIDSLPRLH